MQHVDLLVLNAKQLVTCASHQSAKRGAAMRDVGIIAQGALAIHDGEFVAAGKTADIRAQYTGDNIIDASGKAVVPGLVDCHTHAVYAGNRLDEFEMRIQGKTYMEIMNAGGGIMNTVRATRAASYDDLFMQSKARLDTLLHLGTTTAEIKTGYGLNYRTESKMMDVILRLADEHPLTIVPTYLGPHAKPPEFETPQDYLVSLYDDSMSITQISYSLSPLKAQGNPLFADIFCEENVFSVDDMRQYFNLARQRGQKLKAHIDEFVNLGAVPIAVEMGATSVDHLDVTPQHELDILAQSDTAGVMLPAVNFNLGSTKFADARYLIDAGGVLALATDLNPGSAPTPSLPMVMAIATRYQKLLPSEALNACTINAACAIDMAHRVGSIEAGKQADLLILDTDDYRDLAYQFGGNLVVQVIIKGRIEADN